jgi:hypothetical protein
MPISTTTSRLLCRVYLNNPEEKISTTTSRLLCRVYLNNPEEKISTTTSRLLCRVYLTHNLDEIIASITNRIQVRNYLNLLEEIGVMVNKVMLKSYASTILSENDQAGGYWTEWPPPTPPMEKKRRRFFVSVFSYERDKNK